MKSLYVAVAAALLGASLSACGGGASSGATPVTAGPASVGRGTTTINVTVPAPTTGASAARRPQYISSSTTQLVVDIQANSVEVQGFPQTFGLTPTSPGCSVVGGSTQCTLTVSLAAGTYAVVLTAKDAVGQSLSTTSVPLTVNASSNNPLNVTLSGVLSSIVVTPTSPLVTGTQAAGFTLVGQGVHAFTVNALDIDGNVMIGPGAPTFNVSSTGTLALAVATPAPTSPNVFSVSPPSTLSVAAGSLSIAAHYAAGLTNPCPVVADVCTTGVNVSMQALLAIIESAQVTLYPEGSTTVLATITSGLVLASAGAFDSSGNLFVADQYLNDVQEYAPPYTGAPTTISSGINLPDALVVDPAGDIYVANTSNLATTIEEFAPGATTPSRTIARVSGASSMCLDPSGDLITVDNGANGEIDEYLPGATTSAYSVTGVLFPDSVSCDPSGNVWVARYGDDFGTEITSVDKYTAHLVYSTSLGGVTGPAALATDANYIYVGNGGGSSTNVILFNNPNLTIAATITSGLSYPLKIVVDGLGNIFVADESPVPPYRKVLEYLVGTTTPNITILASPAGMAISP